MELGKWRMIYLLDRAIEYIKDNEMFLNFTEEWSINWTKEELNYFRISENEINELDEYGYIED